MKKFLKLAFAIFLSLALFGGCASPTPSTTSNPTTQSTSEETATKQETSLNESQEISTEAESPTKKEDSSKNAPVKIGSLKGPTTIGLVHLMEQDEQEKSAQDYTFNMYTAADELLTKVIASDVDIALVPANMASILYNKTQGDISVIDINTLGALYMISSDQTIKSIADLSGKTVYLIGKGTTPDYALQYLLEKNGLTSGDVTLEYKSEATEVVSMLSQMEGAIGLLPQPFVTVACTQNESLQIVLDLTSEWNNVSDGSTLVAGVTIVRNEFLKENPDAVKTFLEEHALSAEQANIDVDKTAELVVKAGIIEKAPIAKKAIPYCNITYIDGEEMKTALSGYLTVLSLKDISLIGGKLPEDAFYLMQFPSNN